MSDSGSFENSVEWFVNLSGDEKERIIENFGSNLGMENTGRFRDIIIAIQENVTIDSLEKAIEELTDAGMSSLFAEELVEATIQVSPPNSLVVAELDNLETEQWQQILDLSLRQYSEPIADEDIFEGIETVQTTPVRLKEMIQQVYMQYLRGEIDLEFTKDTFVDFGVSVNRADEIINSYSEYEEITWKRLVFRNSQRVRTDDIEDLRSQQREIRGLLDQLLTIIENAARESDT